MAKELITLERYNKLSSDERYSLGNRAIIRALQNLGGQASRSEILDQIRNYDPEVDQEVVDNLVKAKRTGNLYSNFQQKVNFDLVTMHNTGIVERPSRGIYKLNPNAIDFDPDSEDFTQQLLSLENHTDSVEIENPKNVEFTNSDDEQETDVEKEAQFAREELNRLLLNLHPRKFEILCRQLLKKMNVEIDQKIGLQYVGDGGVDGFGYIKSSELKTDRIAIQGKIWDPSNKVSSPEIDKFRGAMDKYNAEYGVFITTSSFTRAAIDSSRAGTKMITLIDGKQLLDLIIKYKVFVHKALIIEDFYK